MLGTIYSPTDLQEGDRIFLIKDASYTGTIKKVEENRLSVMVLWDDMPSAECDFQWANKVAKL